MILRIIEYYPPPALRPEGGGDYEESAKSADQ